MECGVSDDADSGHCQANKANLNNNSRKSRKDCYCTRELDWVCGDDGKDYTNPCSAGCSGAVRDEKRERESNIMQIVLQFFPKVPSCSGRCPCTERRNVAN